MFKYKSSSNYPPAQQLPPADPALVPCSKPVETVPYCQWRRDKRFCSGTERHLRCTGVWERGCGR